MPRVLKKTPAGTLEFKEELVDPDGDTLTVDEVILYAIDGTPVNSVKQDPPWLSYQTLRPTTPPDESIVEVFVQITASKLTIGAEYEFRFTGSDPFDTATLLTLLKTQPS